MVKRPVSCSLTANALKPQGRTEDQGTDNNLSWHKQIPRDICVLPSEIDCSHEQLLIHKAKTKIVSFVHLAKFRRTL